MKLNLIGWKVEQLIHRLTHAFAIVPVAVVFLMMLMITISVAGRYLLNKPLKGDMDFIELAMVVVVYLGLAKCTYLKRHIEVDVIYMRLPKGVQKYLDVLVSLIGAFIFAIIAWQLFDRAWRYLVHPPGSFTFLLYIPHWPFMFIAAIGAGLMTLEILVTFVHSLAALKGQHSPNLMQTTIGDTEKST